METQSQAASADYPPPSDMAHHPQQLQQTGFDAGQVRALASFVGDVVRDTMRPFIKHVDQRFNAVNQRLDDMNHRFDDIQNRVDRVEARLDNLEQRAGGLSEGMARLDERIAAVQRLEWMAVAMLGLGFVGITVAIVLAPRLAG